MLAEIGQRPDQRLGAGLVSDYERRGASLRRSSALSRFRGTVAMKRILLILIQLVVSGSTISVLADELTIHLDRPGAKVSPTLYGAFFEDINRAGDGGLYAEMVQNRSFEDNPCLIAWT